MTYFARIESDLSADNNVGDTGALALADALKVNHTLTGLNLQGTLNV
jgi:hypothetical protein